MSVSVYFCNQIIQIAVGTRGKKAKLSNVYTTMAPEGSIINGIIMDYESLATHMNSFWSANNLPKKEVYLVLNSNKIAGKGIEIPKLNEKKTLGFIMREFSDLQREDDENTIAYIDLNSNQKTKFRQLYAELAPKDQLREFLQLFSDMGINLKGIISSEGSIIGYAQQNIIKKFKTFVLQIINGNLVSNVLFVEGEYKYYNSVRCFNEPGTEAYLDDLARSLDQLGQFMNAQKISSNLEMVYVAGTSKTNISQYSQVVREHGNTAPIELFNPGISADAALNQEAQNALFAVSGLYDQGKISNFLTHFSLKEDKEGGLDPLTKRRFVTVITTLAVMLAGLGIALTMRLIRESQYKELKEYNNSPSVVMQTAEYDAAVERRDAMLNKYNSINTVVETIGSYPVGSEEIIKIIEDTARGYAEIEILSFDADAGKITFSAKSKSVDNVYKYIDELLKEDIFMTVDHTGYTYDDSSSLYDIHVDCTLAESVGRSE
ncbi:MAG: hypothetical protein K6F55_08630 [Eubacterium sp.]|nr:hypothetical protein [Eubacterium sp.]